MYVIRTMLRPFGLVAEFRSGNQRNVFELSWPGGSPGCVVRVGLDRLRLAFDTVSGLRESQAARGHLGRVSREALAVDCRRPVVSEWALELVESLAALSDGWRPGRQRLTVYLTHDVDVVHPLTPVQMAGYGFRSLTGLLRGRLAPARDLWHHVANAGRFWETYETFMRMEQQAGAKATYFFMTGPYSFRHFGAHGGRPINRLRQLLRMAGRYGHRIGLHGSIDALALRRYGHERRELSATAGREVTWHRNHYLVWDAARSPAALAEAGLEVDSTCGFHDNQGFRAGLAWPYRLWDLEADGPADVMEIPLVFMDAVEDVSSEKTWSQLYKRLDRVAAVGGAVAVLCHVDLFIANAPATEHYRRMLTWLGERAAVLDADCPKPQGPENEPPDD